MNNASRILALLDGYLDSSVELTLYDRAALQLGFSSPRPEFASSLDVDGVLWAGQAEELARGTDFWQAVTRVNRELAPRGLYISHFFEEAQIILTPEWRQHRVAIPGSWRRLSLYRLGDGDLFLSKLMRYDPQDLDDARFIAERAGLSREDIRGWIERARVPDIPEIREQFQLCAGRFT
ncbi:MAG: hypothetical protein KA248_12150 [Kiritimatiellae bacterium]|nr:hypothetical protein [Kiritimatiellia bacterium]